MTREQKLDAAVRAALDLKGWWNVMVDIDLMETETPAFNLALHYPGLMNAVYREFAKL